jgi:hypothetical protein
MGQSVGGALVAVAEIKDSVLTTHYIPKCSGLLDLATSKIESVC